MKVGDLIRFKRTNIVGVVVSMEKRTHDYTEVKVFHDVAGIPNPSGFTLSNLWKTAEVINESR